MQNVNAMPSRPLRPMNVGDILDESIQLYRANFLAFLGITALLQVPFGVIVGGLVAAVVAAVSGQASEPGAGLAVAGGIGGLIVGVIALFMYALITGALSVAISRSYLGMPVTIVDSYRAAGHRLLALVGSELLFGVLCLLMSITIIGIPFAIYFAIKWALVAPVTVLEGTPGGMASLRRSSALVTGSWWRTLGILLLVSIIVGILSSIVSGILGAVLTLPLHDAGLVATIIRQVIGSLVGILFTPISAGVSVLLFYDYKIRKEGFDLEALAQHHSGLSGDPGTQAPGWA